MRIIPNLPLSPPFHSPSLDSFSRDNDDNGDDDMQYNLEYNRTGQQVLLYVVPKYCIMYYMHITGCLSQAMQKLMTMIN